MWIEKDKFQKIMLSQVSPQTSLHPLECGQAVRLRPSPLIYLLSPTMANAIQYADLCTGRYITSQVTSFPLPINVSQGTGIMMKILIEDCIEQSHQPGKGQGGKTKVTSLKHH